MKLRKTFFLVTVFTFVQISSSYAAETVLDGITPQTDSSISYYGLSDMNYGVGFIPGESREISAIEILVSQQISAGKVIGRIYQNSLNGKSGSGTFIAELTQPSAATSYSGGVSNSYKLRLTGSAQVESGSKYWIYFTGNPYSGTELNAWGTTTPTISNGWAIAKDLSNYGMTNKSNYFAYSVYPILKILVSTPTTIDLSLNSGTTTVIYRSTSVIRATVNSDGPVTFYANSKKISGCSNVRSISGVAQCNWKSSIHGQVRLSARVIPNDSTNYSPKTSSIFSVNSIRRTNQR